MNEKVTPTDLDLLSTYWSSETPRKLLFSKWFWFFN